MPVKFNGSTSGYTQVQAAAVAGSGTLTLPTATGNLIGTGDTGTVTQTMIGTNVVGNGPAFSAYLSTNQTITSSTFTKVQLNAELFDTNSNFDPTTNYRFTPTVSGYYQIGWAVSGFASTSPTRCLSTLYKNGNPYAYGNDHVATSGTGTSVGSVVVSMNGSTDYLELYGLITATTAIISTSGGASIYTYMSGALVRSA